MDDSAVLPESLMQRHSQLVSRLDQGVVLAAQLDELDFTAFVVISAPDIDQVARFVTPQAYARLGALHVTAIAHPDQAQAEIDELAFHMNPGDGGVFLCQDQASYLAALRWLGQPDAPSPLN